MADDRQWLRHVQRSLAPPSPCGHKSWDGYQRRVLAPVLETLEMPELGSKVEDVDVKLVDAVHLHVTEAASLVESDKHLTIPVFVKNAQSFNWEQDRPSITQLWPYLPDLSQEADVQQASDPAQSDMNQKMTLEKLRVRFKGSDGRPDPCNILDIPSPMSDRTLPSFLHGPNASLLQQVLYRMQANPDLGPRRLRLIQKHVRKSNVILLGEGGAITTTHQDGCGFGTWITCQQGEIGFAWLCRPNAKMLHKWTSDPDSNQDLPGDERWCLKVLRQYDTVYFPPGLVHFVVRPPGPGRQTFALAGHVVRRSERALLWAEVLLRQLKATVHQKITKSPGKSAPPLPFNDNVEDTVEIALLMLSQVGALLDASQPTGQIDARRDLSMPDEFVDSFVEIADLVASHEGLLGKQGALRPLLEDMAKFSSATARQPINHVNELQGLETQVADASVDTASQDSQEDESQQTPESLGDSDYAGSPEESLARSDSPTKTTRSRQLPTPQQPLEPKDEVKERLRKKGRRGKRLTEADKLEPWSQYYYQLGKNEKLQKQQNARGLAASSEGSGDGASGSAHANETPREVVAKMPVRARRQK